MSLEQRKALLAELEVIAFDPAVDEDISELLESADIKNQGDLNEIPRKSEWGSKSEAVRSRKKKWLNRFVDKEASIKVRPDRENLMTEWKRKANNKNWGPFNDLPIISRRIGNQSSQQEWVSNSSSVGRGREVDNAKKEAALMCDKCWGIVGTGSGLCCQYCHQVVHASCLLDDAARVSAHLDGWVCDVCCKGDIAAGFQEDTIIAKRTAIFKHMYSVHKIQSFARMVPYRKAFRVLRRGVRAIQRSYRGIVFWRTQFKEKVRQRRPFRIRLHNFYLFVNNTGLERPHELSSLPGDYRIKIGHFPTSLYEQYVAPMTKERRASIQMGLELPNPPASEMNDALKTQIKWLKGEYKEYPSYFGGVGSQYQPVKLAATDAYFITVTLMEYDWETLIEKQIYRIDIPLTMQEPHNMYGSIVKELYGHEWMAHIPSQESHVEGRRKSTRQDPLSMYCESFNRDLHVLKANLSKTCSNILIPGAPACVDLVMTVSKVTHWPKADVVGQQRERITQNLIWRNLTTYSQGMCPAVELGPGDVPSVDEHSKLLLYLPQKKEMKKVSGRAEVLQRLTAPRGRNVSRPGTTGSATGSNDLPVEVQTAGASVCWSVLPGSTEDSMHGPVILLADETVTSARTRRWLVAMDHLLYFYVSPGDHFPNKAVELKYFYSVSVDDNMVIRLIRRRPPVDAYYMLIADSSLRNQWVRVLGKLIMQHT